MVVTFCVTGKAAATMTIHRIAARPIQHSILCLLDSGVLALIPKTLDHHVTHRFFIVLANSCPMARVSPRLLDSSIPAGIVPGKDNKADIPPTGPRGTTSKHLEAINWHTRSMPGCKSVFWTSPASDDSGLLLALCRRSEAHKGCQYALPEACP